MISPLNALTSSRIGLELEGRLGDQNWYLLAADEPERAAEDLCAALDGAGVRYRLQPAPDPRSLTSDQRDHAACVVTGTSTWDADRYSALDRLRTSIRDAHPVLLWITTPAAAQQFIHLAPNFTAFFTPAIGVWSDGAMSAADIQGHLAGLRARHGLSDSEILAMAEAGELPADADHHAWLVLLGRGDLISRSGVGAP